MDDTDIRQLLAAGERTAAFERIVERFGRKVFHLAFSMLRNEASASDLAQDALVRVWKGLPGYDGRASVSTWIYTITRNACLNELARQSRRPTVALDAPESEALAGSLAADEGSGARASHLDIEPLLARLPERQRRVLELFYLEQRSYEESAAMLGVPLGTLKTLLFRARQALAELAARETAREERCIS